MPDYANAVISPDRIQPRGSLVIERDVANLGVGVNQAISPFGCCNFFDTCSDEGLFTLFFNGGLDLLDWMGFEVSNTCFRKVEYLNFVAPDPRASTGAIADPCEAPRGIDFGSCSLEITDFGRYGRKSKTRDSYKPEKYCENSPVRFIDGTLVQSESQWDEFMTMNAVLLDVRKAMITGNAATDGQFDGLEQIVATGYDCESLDSYVVDWNANPMAGGPGITLNGNATPEGFDIVDWLLDLWRNIKTRISWSPMLQNQQRRVGDSILVLPGFMARCLLDFYTCWSVCTGVEFEEANKSPSIEMRDFRLQLNGGLFGHGRIFLDGEEIPLLIYDWELIKGPTRGDMYFLTGAIGNMRVWEGEHLDSRVVPQEFENLGIAGNPGNFFTRDDGRVLGKVVTDETCYNIHLTMRPRIFCKAPWAQIRFQNVVCRTPSGPLSPDPTESSFYIEDPLTSASCP